MKNDGFPHSKQSQIQKKKITSCCTDNKEKHLAFKLMINYVIKKF